MGTNKRYERQIDQRMAAKVADSAARPPIQPPAVREWTPPWPPISTGEGEWIIMRDSKREPVGVVRKVVLGPRSETFFRVVTWAERSEDRQLIGYFATLSEADESILFKPTNPTMPDPRTSSGH